MDNKEKALNMAMTFVGHDTRVINPITHQLGGVPSIEEVSQLVVTVAMIFEAYLDGRPIK